MQMLHQGRQEYLHLQQIQKHEGAGLNSKEDVTKELQKSRSRRDNNDLATVKRGIEECMNPFDPKHKGDNLFCLSTIKSASSAVKHDLLHVVRELGEKYYKQFKSECLSDSSRFRSPDGRTNISLLMQLRWSWRPMTRRSRNYKGHGTFSVDSFI